MSRTAGKLRRAVVLGGRAVFPAMVGLALTTPGAAWTASAASGGTLGGPDHAEPRAVIASPVDGSQFRVGVPVTLSAEPGPGDAQGGDELRWTVIRHTGTASEAVSEAGEAGLSLMGLPSTHRVRMARAPRLGAFRF